jgi:hypothetical protein
MLLLWKELVMAQSKCGMYISLFLHDLFGASFRMTCRLVRRLWSEVSTEHFKRVEHGTLPSVTLNGLDRSISYCEKGVDVFNSAFKKTTVFVARDAI